MASALCAGLVNGVDSEFHVEQVICDIWASMNPPRSGSRLVFSQWGTLVYNPSSRGGGNAQGRRAVEWE